MDRQEVINQVFWMLIHFSTCLKHPAFGEEREWRLVHLPKLFPSDHLRSDIETINGMAQRVFKLRFDDALALGIKDAALPELIDRIIIGPTDEPLVVWDAIVDVLSSHDVPDAESKVVMSHVPLRT